MDDDDVASVAAAATHSSRDEHSRVDAVVTGADAHVIHAGHTSNMVEMVYSGEKAHT
jgi:hypothetical protein